MLSIDKDVIIYKKSSPEGDSDIKITYNFKCGWIDLTMTGITPEVYKNAAKDIGSLLMSIGVDIFSTIQKKERGK